MVACSEMPVSSRLFRTHDRPTTAGSCEEGVFLVDNKEGLNCLCLVILVMDVLLTVSSMLDTTIELASLGQLPPLLLPPFRSPVLFELAH